MIANWAEPPLLPVLAPQLEQLLQLVEDVKAVALQHDLSNLHIDCVQS
jgi:hypothetical protein